MVTAMERKAHVDEEMMKNVQAKLKKYTNICDLQKESLYQLKQEKVCNSFIGVCVYQSE